MGVLDGNNILFSPCFGISRYSGVSYLNSLSNATWH